MVARGPVGLPVRSSWKQGIPGVTLPVPGHSSVWVSERIRTRVRNDEAGDGIGWVQVLHRPSAQDRRAGGYSSWLTPYRGVLKSFPSLQLFPSLRLRWPE